MKPLNPSPSFDLQLQMNSVQRAMRKNDFETNDAIKSIREQLCFFKIRIIKQQAYNDFMRQFKYGRK